MCIELYGQPGGGGYLQATGIDIEIAEEALGKLLTVVILNGNHAGEIARAWGVPPRHMERVTEWVRQSTLET